MGVRNCTEEDMFKCRLKNWCEVRSLREECLRIRKGSVVGTHKGQGEGHRKD